MKPPVYECYFDDFDYHDQQKSGPKYKTSVFLMFFFSLATCVYFLFSCQNPPTLEKFVVYYDNDSVVCEIKDSLVTAYVPVYADKAAMQVSVTLRGKQYPGKMDLSEPAYMVFEGKPFTIVIQTFNKIPILSINTANKAPIESKDVYLPGQIIVDGNTDSLRTYLMQIKGRGNSTWFQPKKPYKIKLDNKIKLMGMPAEKEFALLANYLDKTLIRNDVAFELSERLKMPWTPRRRIVDVFLNGQYNGNYLLTETVKTGKDRLNINLMDPKKPNDTTHSFLVEADYRHDAIQTWTTSGIPLDMKDPDSLSQKQLAYVIQQFQNITDNMNAGADLRQTLNIDTWIKWGIVNELMRNRDGTLYGSCYFYRDTTGKIAMGPVWDVDLSSGGYENNVPQGWYVNNANWISWLFFKSTYYRPRLKEIWNEYKGHLSTIDEYIDKQASYIEMSQKENYLRWSNLSTIDYPGQFAFLNYKTGIDNLKSFLKARFEWMDNEISHF